MLNRYLAVPIEFGKPWPRDLRSLIFGSEDLAKEAARDLNRGFNHKYGDPYLRNLKVAPLTGWAVVEETQAHLLDPLYGTPMLAGAGEYSL